ncbi:MAG: hypothetical protein ACTSWR_11525 [Candidatus Helarchaeota archaeon]
MYENLPRTQIDIISGGLAPKFSETRWKKSIMLIGTAPYGPVNQAIKCNSENDVLMTFGSTEKSTLFRAYVEAKTGEYKATDYIDQIYLVRLSNGNLASINLPESPPNPSNEFAISSDEAGAIQDAVTITALYPGSIYNGITFSTYYKDGLLYIKAVNPITGVASLYRYSTIVSGNGIVSDCKTFVEAINNDPNIGSICKAAYHKLSVSYEMDLIDPDVETSDKSAGITWIDKDAGSFILDLPRKLDACDTDDDWITESATIHYPSSATPKPVPTTSSNRLLEIKHIYEVVRDRYRLEIAGYNSMELDPPTHVDENNKALPLLNYGNYETADPGVNETMIQVPRNLYVGTGNGSTKEFSWQAEAAVDPTAVDENGNPVLKVYWQFEGDQSKIEQPSSSYTLDDSEVATNGIMKIIFDSAPPAGTFIIIDYNSEEIPLTLAASLTDCMNSNDFKTYWISGDRITFGATQPKPIEIAYISKRIIGIGSDVVINDAKNGILSFSNGAGAPNIKATLGTTVGIELTYQPEFISLASSFSLQGGTDGVDLTENEKYELLDTFLTDYADAYPVDLIVPVGFHLDAVKTQFSEDTGYQTEVNAGYHTLFHNFCEAHRDLHETHVIMSIKPPENNDPDTVNEWFRKAIYTSNSDPNRAANIISGFSSKWISVVAMAPVYANTASNGIAYRGKPGYGSDGAASYAGLLAALNVEPSQAVFEAATNKPLGGIIGSYIKLGDRKVNELVGMRYVTLRNIPGVGLVIASDVTCDSKDGDFHFFSNFECVQHVTSGVREVGFPFIGKGWNKDQKAALETALQRLFDNLISRKVLVAGNFKIKTTPQDLSRGIISIDLILVPSLQVQVIKVTVKLQPNLK